MLLLSLEFSIDLKFAAIHIGSLGSFNKTDSYNFIRKGYRINAYIRSTEQNQIILGDDDDLNNFRTKVRVRLSNEGTAKDQFLDRRTEDFQRPLRIDFFFRDS